MHAYVWFYNSWCSNNNERCFWILPPLLDDNDEKTKSASANITSEILQIISGAENITNFVLQHYLMTQATMDVCLDFVGPSYGSAMVAKTDEPYGLLNGPYAY